MDGEPPQEEDFSQIPLVERSQHKNWKARVSAYTDVISKSAKTASDTDPFFRPFVSDGALLKKWCLDANAVAQEKGIEAVLAIAQYSGETSAKIRPDVVPAIVDKALGSARAGTKKKGMDLCAMFVEVENSGEGVMEDVMAGFNAKLPKTVAGSITCLKEIIESFGVPALGNIKPLLKSLSKIFGHSDKNVRAEGTTLTLVLYTYLGPALLPALADLKPVQMTELQKSFDSMDAEGKGAGTGKATRFTRKTQRDREAAEASGGGDDDGDAQEEIAAAPIDPKSLLDPVDVLALFPGDLMDRLGSTKWKDRLESLEECTKVLTQPQNASISDKNVDSYGPLAQILGTKCKSDANINVVIEASKVIEGLAKGMGRSFGRFRSTIMPGVLDRLKERKVNVTDALGKALDALFLTTPFADMVEDILNSLKSKNPQVKEGTLKFLHRSLQTTTEAPGKDQIKPIAQALVALLGDSTEPVRTTAAECLGTMMKILGERVFNPFIEGVGELQMAKVKDAFGRAEIKYKAGGAPKAAPKPVGSAKTAPATVKKVPKPAPSASTRPPPTAATSSSKPPSKPVAAQTKTAAASSSKSGPSKSLATSPSEPVKYRYSPEEAASIAADTIPAEYHTKLADGAWKIRLEAAEEMVKWIGEEDGAEKVNSEVMMRFLGKTPGWGEKNFQVSAKLYQVMGLMAEKSPTFGKPSAAFVIGHLTDKLGDMKLKKPAGDALTIFAEKTSLAFVLAQGYEPMTKQKAPKAQADSLTWIKQQLIDFGIAGIPLKDLISFVKNALGSPNALVRKSATEVLVTVRIAVGADISGFMEDLNPQLLNTINSEFDKVSTTTPPEPTKTQADLQETAPSAGSKGGKGNSGADPLDDLIPRQDLDKLVASTSVIADSKSDAWKARKEAFEALNAILEVKSNNRLKPNMGEIGGVLKKAMADTNLSVKMLALGIISKIATGMGQPFDKYHRLLVAPVASVCADQKAPTRAAATATLTAMADATGGLDGMFTGLGTSLESTNPILRATVLGWLAARVKEDPPSSSADLSPLAGPILTCLEDRNGDVRKGAGAILPFVVASAGYDYVMDQTSKLKPASRATIVPLINNARSSAPGPSSSATASSAVPSRGATTPATSRVAKSSAALRSAPGSPAPASVPSLPKPSAVPSRSMAMKALSSVPSSRPVSSLSQGDDHRPTGLPKSRMALSRPPSSASISASHASSIPTPSSSRNLPFLGNDLSARSSRLKRDATRWIIDTSPKSTNDLSEYLQHQMEPQLSPELFSSLYSKDHRAEEDYMAGLSTMSEFYDSAISSSTYDLAEEELQSTQLANVDLALKYAALKLLGNNTQLANRCLELLSNIVDLMPRYNERFSDAEAKLFVPALVFKLGDAKFGPKLAPIFESLDKVIAGSQVVALLVQYGLEDKSAGKTCKNESLALIEKAYKKRGSILRTREDKGFYETIARCINDSGTRNAALSVMALLQLQGESKSLSAVIESMSNSSKDMLANRRSTMAASKTGPTNPLVSKMSHDSLPEGSPRLKRPQTGATTPRLNHLPRETHVDSPRASGSASPASKLPRSGIASPSLNRTIQAPSGLPRPGGIPAPSIPSAATSRLQRPTGNGDVFGAASNVRSAALQPLNRAPAPKSSGPDVIKAINEIRHDDLDRCVDALKVIQHMLSSTPELFVDNVETLSDTLMDEMEFAFTPPENLHEPRYFRVVKHLIQSFSGLSSNQDLMRRLSYSQLYSVLNCLSLRLVQADKLGGAIQDMSRFFNLVLVQCLSTPDRLLVFKVMFKLLLDLTQDFSLDNVKPENERASHPDLVIKCLWKRCKILDDDFRSNRLKPGPLLAVLEDFLQGVGPSEYRRRAAEGIALGDMPLRTVKTIIQKMLVYTQEAGLEVYDILLNQFGDEAASTIVYTYVFRLAGRETSKPAKTPLMAVSENGRPASAASHATATSIPSERPASSSSTPTFESASILKEDSEAERLVKNLRSENQAKSLDGLYAFIKSRPDAEDEVNAAIAAHLTPTFQTYVRRMIDQRKNTDNPSPARGGVSSPLRSPSRPESMPPALKPIPNGSRKSIGGPRPSSLAINVDKNLPLDDQLAQYKNLFRNQANLNNSNGDGSISPSHKDISSHEVLGEIQPQDTNIRDSRGPRSSDVD
uniref:Microtubule Associated protein n=1 Tax=Kwoniella pini CBS 10737 TaxID=1296096 RepID=A0A1B9I4Q5_9TREE|nr:microtubule Associated protein [Kwoniella pini CBS 10737]OCF50492.1 microtubule Associated protein [Kwoniella pini CBS 10737]